MLPLAALAPLLGKIGGGGSGGGLAGKAVGAVTGLATSAVQGLQALKLKKKADAAMPELVDPRQASYLAELNQKRRSIETGADFASATNQAESGQAAANDAITHASGGDTGSTIQGLLQAQRNAGDIKNQAIAQGQSQQQFYDNAFGGLQREMSARALQLQLLNSQQLRAQWDQKSKAAGANFQGAIGQLAGMRQQPAGSVTPVVDSPPVDSLGKNDAAVGAATPAAPDATNMGPLMQLNGGGTQFSNLGQANMFPSIKRPF